MQLVDRGSAYIVGNRNQRTCLGWNQESRLASIVNGLLLIYMTNGHAHHPIQRKEYL
jgi:hypothetical protein